MGNGVGNFGDFQYGIYAAGIGGVQPRFPVLYGDLRKRAQEVLDARIFGYVAGGAGNGLTQAQNVEAFQTYGIVPRMLRDRTTRDLSVELFGRTLASPIYVAPVGVLGAVHPDGDLETAKAATAVGVPLVCSTLSSSTMEQTRAASRGNLAFFQLYPPSDAELCEHFVSRAITAGFDGIVVTVDTGSLGWRPYDLQKASIPMHYGQCLANYATDPAFWRLAGVSSEEELTVEKTIATWDRCFSDPTFSWSHIDKIRAMTNLPLLIKGICTPEDARTAIDHGVDGIICSNHGGRQANGGLPALEHLAAVVEAVPDNPVLFDSGVRTGVDVLKALALGAALVGIGRPYVYGLALGGAEGVEFVLRCLLAEADLTMAVDCYASIAEIRDYGLKRVEYLSTQVDDLV
ncbi:MAG: alpha-hydroxy-acid oxidizing protein [Mycobacterium sp.]